MEQGAVAWTVALAGPLAWDALLMRRGRLSLSEHARRHPLVTIALMAYFSFHLLQHPHWLARFDPLAFAGRMIGTR